MKCQLNILNIPNFPIILKRNFPTNLFAKFGTTNIFLILRTVDLFVKLKMTNLFVKFN